MNSRALIECAVKGGVRHFIFSLDRRRRRNPTEIPARRDSTTLPISPYGWSEADERRSCCAMREARTA